MFVEERRVCMVGKRLLCVLLMEVMYQAEEMRSVKDVRSRGVCVVATRDHY